MPLILHVFSSAHLISRQTRYLFFCARIVSKDSQTEAGIRQPIVDAMTEMSRVAWLVYATVTVKKCAESLQQCSPWAGAA